MGNLLKREFVYKDIKFYLNDNRPRTEFEGKYNLLYWNELREKWMRIMNVSSKKEAIAWVKENWRYI